MPSRARLSWGITAGTAGSWDHLVAAAGPAGPLAEPETVRSFADLRVDGVLLGAAPAHRKSVAEDGPAGEPGRVAAQALSAGLPAPAGLP